MIGSSLCGGIESEVAGLSGNIYQCYCKLYVVSCTLCRQQGGLHSIPVPL